MSTHQNPFHDPQNLPSLLLQALISQQTSNSAPNTENSPISNNSNNTNFNNNNDAAILTLLSALNKGQNTTFTLGGQTLSLNLLKNEQQSSSNGPEIHLLSSSESQETFEKSEGLNNNNNKPPTPDLQNQVLESIKPITGGININNINNQSFSSSQNFKDVTFYDNLGMGGMGMDRKESFLSEKFEIPQLNKGTTSNLYSEISLSSFAPDSDVKTVAAVPQKGNNMTALLASIIEQSPFDVLELESLPVLGKIHNFDSVNNNNPNNTTVNLINNNTYKPFSFEVSKSSDIFHNTKSLPLPDTNNRTEQLMSSDEEEKDPAILNKTFNDLEYEISLLQEPSLTTKFKSVLELLQKENRRLDRKKKKIEEQKKALMNEQLLKEILPQMSHKESSFYLPSLEAQLHFAFMFAAPLVLCYEDYSRNKKLSPIYIEVDYRTELETLKRILTKSRDELKFRSFVANQTGLGECFNMKPRALHFCGHGVKNNNDNFRYMKSGSGEGDFLIMEDEEGKAEFKSCGHLAKLLQQKDLNDTLDFVFVASCHSSLVGEVFRKAGAKHVICVGREEKILDEACLTFTEHFYQAYFIGRNSVCAAFEKAREYLSQNARFPCGEEKKFILLKQEGFHRCEPIFGPPAFFENNSNNKFQDLTPIPLFNKIPSRIESFLGRHIELHEVLKSIKGQRFVTIKGIPGIGKSSLCREVANYLYERHVFRDGIIYISAIGCDSTEGIVSMLDAKLGYLAKDMREQSVGSIMVNVTNYFLEKVKEALIILDNVDEVYHNDKGKFRTLLELILVTCPRVKILITSRTTIVGIQDVSAKVFKLSHLDEINSRELFFSKAPRPIDIDEMKEFLQNDASLNPEGVPFFNNNNSNMFQTGSSSGGGFLEQELSLQKDGVDELTLFSKHHFMQMLAGHPQAISLAAALLTDRSLAELYQLMTSNPIMKVLKVEGINEDEAKSFNSMQVSLDISLNYLQHKSQEAVEFFGLLGLLPGGVQESDLKTLWGKKWIDCTTLLLRYSLIMRRTKPHMAGIEDTRYILYPFMVKYAEERLREEEIERLSYKITKYLKEKAEILYNKIDSQTYFEVFLKEEINFKSCLKRELETVRKRPESPKKIPERSEQELENNMFGPTEASKKLLAKFHAGKEEIRKSMQKQPKSLARAEKVSAPEKEIVVTENMAHELGPAGLRSSLHVQRKSFVLSRNDNKLMTMSGTIMAPRDKRFTYSSATPKPFDGLSQNIGTSEVQFPLQDSQKMAFFGRENPYGKEIELTMSQEMPMPVFGKSLSEEIPSPGKVKPNNNNNSEHNQESIIEKIELIKPNNNKKVHNNEEDKDKYDGFHRTTSIEYKPMAQAQLLLSKIPEEEKKRDNSAREKRSFETPFMGFQPINTDKLGLVEKEVISEIQLSNMLPDLYDEIMGGLLLSESQQELEDKAKEKGLGKKLDKSYEPLVISRPLNLALTNSFFGDLVEDCYGEVMQELNKPLGPILKTLLERELAGNKAVNQVGEEGEDSSMIGQRTNGDPTRKKATSVHNQPTYNLPIRHSNMKNNILDSPGKSTKRVTLTSHPETNSPFSENVLAKAKQRSTIWKEDDVIAEESEEYETTRTNKVNLSVSTKLDRTIKGDSPDQYSPEYYGQMSLSSHLAVLYCSTLFILLRFDECGKLVEQSRKLTIESKDTLGEANLKKLSACLNWIKSNFEASLTDFGQACDIFNEAGCLLGQATCEAAMGYIKGFVSEETSATNAAIKHLERALEYYKQLDHLFGIYFIHRWLSFIKNKLPGLKAQSDQHAKEARKALSLPKARKEVHGHSHRGGYFVLRWSGDPVSIFLEIANVCDTNALIKKKSRDDEKGFTFPYYSHNSSKIGSYPVSNDKIHPNKPSLWAVATKTTMQELGALKSPGGLAVLKEEVEFSDKEGSSVLSSSDGYLDTTPNNNGNHRQSSDKKGAMNQMLVSSVKKRTTPTKISMNKMKIGVNNGK